MSANTVIKPLPAAWNVGGQVAKEIEMRPPLLGDLLEAEKEANPALQPNAFNVALACQTMVRAGTFTGPFSIAQFKSMKPRNWNVIRDAMSEAELLGEDEPAHQAPAS